MDPAIPMLPQSGMPRQRTNRSGHYWHPRSLPGAGRSLGMACPQTCSASGHGLGSPAGFCGDREPGGHAYREMC